MALAGISAHDPHFCRFDTGCLPLVAHADNWPQWRGPKNDGISNEKNIPTEWNESKNVAWKLPLPGPAVHAVRLGRQDLSYQHR